MSRSLAALLLAIPWLVPASGRPSTVTAFVDVSVVPMDSERVLTGQTVVVQGDRIHAMGPTDQVRVPAGAVQVDGRGKFLIPGLADMHVHLDAGQPAGYNEYMLLYYLGFGITTVRNMRGSPELLELRERVAKGEVAGPRIYTSSPQIRDNMVPTPEAAKQIVAEYKAAGYDFLKFYAEGIKPEVFDTFVAATEREGIRFAGHVPGPPVGIEGMLRGHPASIEHLGGYLPVVYNIPFGQELARGLPHLTIDEMPAMAAATRRAGVWNCPTAAMTMGPANDDELIELFPAMIKALSDSGAGLLLGTDNGFMGTHTINMELEELVNAGLTPYKALGTGTRNVAQFFGTLDSTGTVAVGKRADLVLLNGNPLQDIRNVAEPAGVMLRGQWLPRDVLDARTAAAKKVAEEAVAKRSAEEQAKEAAAAAQAPDTTQP